MPTAEQKNRAGLKPLDYVEAKWAEAFPNLRHEEKMADDDKPRITLACRGDRDWYGVVKRTNADGLQEVIFTNGASILDCLVGLDRGIAKGAWRPDKPWQPRKGPEGGQGQS